jgi:hypothetical protein
MSTFATAGWIVMAALWLLVAFYVYRIIRQNGSERLVRCPETGAITLVSIAPAARRDGDASALEVRHCALWQDRQEDCAQGCLTRYPEMSPGYRVNLRALRPFAK